MTRRCTASARLGRHVLCAAPLACAIEFPSAAPRDRGVYSEGIELEALEQSLPTLATHETEVYLAIRPADVETGALESLLLAARRHGVPVRAWLLLDDELGKWPGEHQLDDFDVHVRRFWQWNRRAHLGVEWIVVDLQPTLERGAPLWTAVETGELDTATSLLQAGLDAAAFASAREQWISAVDAWHDDGMLVAVLAPSFVLDDFGDDDGDVQDMLDAPVEGPDWDELGFRVFQSHYREADARLGPALVYDYARTIAARWGDRGQLALGTIGDAGSYANAVGYGDRDALDADLAAAAGAGIGKLQLFDLRGIEQHGGIGTWTANLDVAPSMPATDPRVAAARATISALDR